MADQRASRPRRAHSAARLTRRRTFWLGLAGSGLAVAVAVSLILVTARGSGHVAATKPAPRAGRSSGTQAPDPAGVALDPSLFTAGSCVELAPTSAYRGKTVFLDAGHGGIDPGAVGVTSSGQTIHEADETLPVELATATLLRADGYRVVLSRTRQTIMRRPGKGDVSGHIFTVQGELSEIAARDICANLAKADILVAVYFDAGGSEQNAGSVTAYDRARPFWRKSLRLATLVQRDVLSSLNANGWGIPDDGVQSDVSLGGPPLSSGGARYGHLLVLGPAMSGYFSTPSTMPGALIEPLFITDPFEGSLAASAKGQHAIASGLAKAVEQYFAPNP